MSRHRKTLETSRARARDNLVQVTFDVTPPDALVSLDGSLVGSATDIEDHWVEPGALEVRVSTLSSRLRR